MRTNQSNETTMKVISITIMAVTVNKNNNLHRSKKYKHFKLALSVELKFALHHQINRNDSFFMSSKCTKLRN